MTSDSFTITISHPRHGQVSGHDFSALPDARIASEGCVVVPKERRKDYFLAPQAVAQRSEATKIPSNSDPAHDE
jgi:hypothetical protein